MKPIELVTRCRQCGREWIPLRRDYAAGQWHTCPQCRTEAEPDPLDATNENEEREEAA